MTKLNYEQKRALRGFLHAMSALKGEKNSNVRSYYTGILQAYSEVLLRAPCNLYLRLLELDLQVNHGRSRFLP